MMVPLLDPFVAYNNAGLNINKDTLWKVFFEKTASFFKGKSSRHHDMAIFFFKTTNASC